MSNTIKIVLGKVPEFFTKDVTVKLLDGSTGVITCKFKYRTKTEFGTFIDAIFKEATAADAADGADDAAAPPVTAATISMEDLMTRTVDKNADYLLEVLTGWGLDQPLTRDNLVQLANELPGVATQIMTDYRAAVVEGRLGN